MFTQILNSGIVILLCILFSGCGYIILEKPQKIYIPVFRFEGIDLNEEVLSPIEVYEDTNQVPHEFIVIGTIIVSEEELEFPFNLGQDERLYNKLIQEASLSDADAISNIKYYTEEIRYENNIHNFTYPLINYNERVIKALKLKYTSNIIKLDHICLKIDLKEPALITIIVYDLQEKVVDSALDSYKHFAEWGPIVYYKKDLLEGVYKFYTKGVHYYNERVLWEKSKWIQIVNLNE